MKKNGTRRLSIVDVDGTLVFNDEARAMASKEIFGKRMIPEVQYKALSRTDKDRIHSLTASKYKRFLRANDQLINRLNRRTNEMVLVLTGRQSNVETDTRETLKSIGLRYDELHTNHNPVLTHTQFKISKLVELARGFDQVEVYEDDEENIRQLKKIADSRFDFFRVNQRGIFKA
jgi:beta-phosphoglucomutase-like phosphatase (HAD superfamily)